MKKGLAQFTWRGIMDEEFAVFNEYYRAGQTSQISFNLAFEVSPNERMLFCKATADFLIGGSLYLRCSLVSAFELHESSWKERLAKLEQKVTIEKELLIHFSVFTVGSLRGYLHARQQRSPVSAALPPINVVEIVAELGDIVEDLTPQS